MTGGRCFSAFFLFRPPKNGGKRSAGNGYSRDPVGEAVADNKWFISVRLTYSFQDVILME